MCYGGDPYFCGGEWDGNPENNKRADQRAPRRRVNMLPGFL